MAKICDNESTGIVIKDGDKFVAIKRINFPISIAFPAGHNDGDTPEDTARKEMSEEVSLDADELSHLLKDEKLQNGCKREGGTWHNWNVFEAVKWSGKLKAASDAKEAFPVSKEELESLSKRTLSVLDELGISLEELDRATSEVVKYPRWEDNPGLEPVWIVLLKKIGILS